MTKMKKKLLFFAAAATLSMPVLAQGTARLAPRSKIMLSARQAPADSIVSAYLTFEEGNTDWNAIGALGTKTVLKLKGVATVRVPLSRLAELSEVRGVKYVQTGTPVGQMLDVARPETGADKSIAGTGLAQSYAGNGVVVGIVDAGFDYSHAAFYDKERNLRVKRVWEQNSDPADYETGKYSSPEKFGYGIELRTQEDMENAGGDITGNSHGTHVANIAAGSDSYMDGAFMGTAPEADIVLVSMGESSRDNVNLSNALAYIFDYAEEVGKPCVINLSLGSHAGPHDGTSTFDVIADQLQGKGRLIVGSAGNHRADKFHIARTFTGAEDEPLKTFVSYYSMPSVYNKGGDIEIWGDKGTEFEVALSAYSITNRKAVETITVDPSAEGAQTVEFEKYLTGTLEVAVETSPLNGKPHVIITSGLTGIRNNYALALTVTPKGSGKVDVWADNIYLGLTSRDIEGFAEPDASSSTIAEIGGTAKRILTVGAYTTRNEYTIYGETTPRSLSETVGDISSFSSYGPTADGRMKPEISAPGCFIISAESSNDNSGTQIIAQRYSDENREYLYGYMQGTSMSAPFVTGVVATWLQAFPEMTPEELAAVVMKTARKDEHTGEEPEKNGNDWGYGKIDAFGGLKACLDMKTSGCISVDAPFAGTITKYGDDIRMAFAAASQRVDVGVYGADGTLAASRTLNGIAAGDEATISVGGLKPGIYLLRVQTGKSVKTMKFRR